MKSFKNILYRGSLILVEPLKKCNLLLIKLSRSSAFPSSCAGCCQSRLGSLPDEIALKFSQCSEYMEDELPPGGRGVYALGDAALNRQCEAWHTQWRADQEEVR